MSNNVKLLDNLKNQDESFFKKNMEEMNNDISNTLDIDNDKSDTHSDPEEQVDTQMKLV